jgi:hypothetical protein
MRLIKAEPFKNATTVRKDASEAFGITISQRTAQRILRRHDLPARSPAKKPVLKKSHKQQRLRFAKQHQNWTVNDWRKVVFSDESRFNIFNPDGGTKVRRPPGKRLDERYLKGTMKFGGGPGVQVWGTILFFKIF